MKKSKEKKKEKYQAKENIRFSQLSKPQKLRRVGDILIYFLLPAIIFYLMEFYEHNPFAEVRAEAQFFNVLILELLGWGLLFVCKKAKISIRILATFFMLFGLLNHYVVKFRSVPLVPWDFLSGRTAVTVAGNYDYTPDARTIIVTVLFLIIIGAVQLYDFKIEMKFYLRLIPTVGLLGILVIFTNLLQDEDFQTKHYLYPFLFTPAYMTKVNGITVTFAMDLAYIAIDKPSGYDQAEEAALLESYETENSDSEESGSTGDYPNVIVIMDEAFSDLSVLSDFSTNEDYMPFVHSILNGEVDNTISGYLNVSVCGGNTANTEFEFLTGNTMAFLPSGSIPYQQYINSEIPTLASHLEGLGYTTTAMHPYYSTGWDRDTTYPLMGFESMLFQDDLYNKQYVRDYVSDAYDFEQIKELYENKGDSPMFLFNVTMQNHGSYTDAYDNFTPSITVDGADSFALSQYLSLIQLTDLDLESLINYFSVQDEKTIIVFFGDHQPNDYTVSAVNGSTEEWQRYQVPYFIWANYDIEDATGQDTSANYLSAKALKAAGIPTSAYQNFLLDLEEDYPIYSVARQETNGDGNEDLLADYKRLEYYQLFDWDGDQ